MHDVPWRRKQKGERCAIGTLSLTSASPASRTAKKKQSVTARKTVPLKVNYTILSGKKFALTKAPFIYWRSLFFGCHGFVLFVLLRARKYTVACCFVLEEV